MSEHDAAVPDTDAPLASRPRFRFSVSPEQMAWLDRESRARGVDRTALLREVFSRGMVSPPGSAAGRSQVPGVGGLSDVAAPTPAAVSGSAAPTRVGPQVGLGEGRGLFLMVSDENGRFSPLPFSADLFRPPPRPFFASFFEAPRAFRWTLVLLVLLALLFGAAYTTMSVVASRYEFREVAVSPGRSVYYKVDRWTGRMTRCRSDVGAVGPVC